MRNNTMGNKLFQYIWMLIIIAGAVLIAASAINPELNALLNSIRF